MLFLASDLSGSLLKNELNYKKKYSTWTSGRLGIFNGDNNAVYGNTVYDNNQNSSGELSTRGEIRLIEFSAVDENDGTIVKNNIAYSTKPSNYAIYIGNGVTNAVIDTRDFGIMMSQWTE